MSHPELVHFEELFDIEELQKLQDQIAFAFGVASIITHPDGTPITRSSNFTRLCQNIIRCTEKGILNCTHSDALIGRQNSGGPIVQPCLSGGLWDAGASITVGNQHVANWLIGQVRNEVQDENRMRAYASEIGADEADFMLAFQEIPSMSKDKFQQIADVLFTLAGQLSEKAYQNLQQSKFIAEKRLAEKALIESEERYRTTLYSIGDGVITTDPEGNVKMMNPVAEQLTGWTQQEASGKALEDVFRIFNEDTRELVEVPVRQVLREGVIVGLANHTVLISKNGTELPIADSGAPIRNETGEIVGVVLVFREQTKEREAEKAIRQRENTLKLFIEYTPAAIAMFDNNMKYLAVSNRFLSDYRLGDQHVIGRSHYEIFPEITERWKTIHKRALAGETFREDNDQFIRTDGTTDWIRWEIHPWYESDNQIGGIILFSEVITKQNEAEQALFESEEMMRNSQSVAHICSYSTNLNEKEIGSSFWKCSPEFYEIFGIDKSYPHTIEGWAGFIHPDYREEVVAYHEYVIREKIPFEHEYKIIRINDGAERWVYGTGKLEFDENGNPVRMHGAIQDITERKRHMETIQNERQLLRTLIDNLPVTIYVKDSNGRKLVANKTDLEVIGKETEEEVLGKTDLEIFTDEIGQRGYQDDLKIIQSREPVINREEIFIDKNGSQRWLLTSKVPIIDQQGNTTGLVGIGRDITEMKKATETIHKLSRSVEQSSSMVLITDKTGLIEYVNPKFSEITGYTREEVIGQNTRILKSGMMPDEFYKILWETITSGEAWRGEIYNRKKNGELNWEWTIITPLRNENGEITNYIATKEDITDRKRMEEDLIEAKKKAEASDRLKSAFLANMSHEIRTPLNSIIGFSELLNDPYFDEEQKKDFIQQITFNGNNLLNVISDIVDFSKIEAGEITIRKAAVNVCELLEKMKKQHFIQRTEKPLEFRWIYPADEPENLIVLADKERLNQVLINLLSNAMKFTSEGYIEVGYRSLDGFVEFSIKDTGIGISAAFHKQIFERFRQGEESYTRKFGGNGLGLAISKNLIELMGGKIWVESEVGEGSAFYFTLPMCKMNQL